MARRIRQLGRVLIFVLPVMVLAILLLLPTPRAQGAPFVNPFWVNVSPSPECPCAATCCEGPGEWAPEGVSRRTGIVLQDEYLFSMPGLVEDNSFALRYRGDISGATQAGNGWLPSWEWTVNAVNSTTILVNLPDGQVWTYNLAGATWVPASCNVTDTLVVVGGAMAAMRGGPVLGPAPTTKTGGAAMAGGQTLAYILTDKHGNVRNFDTLGMPMSYVDRNGNTDTLVYGANYQIQAIADERGHAYAFGTNTNGYITSITDAAGRTWTLGYDGNDNLISITSPPTPDQPLGITRSFAYDGLGRLTTVTDGRGNTEKSIVYVGSTAQVQSVTRYGFTTTFSYQPNLTTRTDPNGNIHRTHWTGATITQTDMWVDGQPKYITQYRYNGNLLINKVLPRGNRVDFVYDGMLNLLSKRYRETDTSTNQSTDLLHTYTYTANFKTSYTDPLGNTWSFARDGAGNLTSLTHPFVTQPVAQSAQESWTYNAAGQRATYTDADGLLTTYVHYTTGANQGLLEKIQVGPVGNVLETSFGYDSIGNVNTRTDPNGNTTTYQYDNLRRLLQTQAPAPLGYLQRSSYDPNGNVATSEVENRDKDGQLDPTNPWFTTSHVYTQRKQLDSVTEEIDAATTRATSFTYDPNGNRLTVTKPEGNVDAWTYDERDLVATAVKGYGDPKASTTSFAYDLNGNQTTVTNGRSFPTTSAYDLFDRQTRVTNALGHYTQRAYDPNGNVVAIERFDNQDQLLQRSARAYDERNRHWQTTDMRQDPTGPLPDAVSTVQRSASGHTTQATDARSNSTTITYDTWHRVDRITDPMGNYVEKTYDSNGNVTAWAIVETDGSSYVMHEYEATYDELNRRLTSIEIDRLNAQNQLVTQYDYDSRSQRVWMVDPMGNPTRWTFDGLGRMVKRERALTLGATIEQFTAAQVTQWAFDKNDRLTAHTDDGTNTTSWAFDALDRPVSMTYPDSSSASYVYDLSHNVTQVTDPAGSVITDVFDALDRNTSRSITRGAGVGGTTAETRTYDALNRMLTNADDDYKIEYAHEVNGLRSLVFSETQSYVGTSPRPLTVTRTHDAVGNTVSEAYPSGMTLARSWNEINRLQTVTDTTNTIASFTYWGSRPKSTLFQNGASQATSYTGFRGEVQQIHHQTSAQATIVQLDYGYDLNHDRLYERFGGAGSSGDGFAYDRLRRLTNAWIGSATPSNPLGTTYTKKIDYNYDDDGNRTSVVVTPWGAGSSSTSYSTNNLYQYTSVGGTTHQWDGNGNLRADGSFRFKYDYRNQLVEVKDSTGTNLVASYRYDPAGRRVEKVVAATGLVERFVYSGLETVCVYDAGVGWKQDFVFGDTIDSVLMLQQADVLDYDNDQNTTEIARHYYHRNALGSVMEITDPAQGTAVSYRYDPYGNATITSGGQVQSTDPLGQHWAFTGRFLDEAMGLYCYRARSYHAPLGRFTARDPMGMVTGPNPYEYVGSSPVVYVDPLGLERSNAPSWVTDCCDNNAGSQSGCKRCCEKNAQAAIRAVLEKFESDIANCESMAEADVLADLDDWADVGQMVFSATTEVIKIAEKAKDTTALLSPGDILAAAKAATDPLKQYLVNAVGAWGITPETNVAMCIDRANQQYANGLSAANRHLAACLGHCATKCVCDADYALPPADRSFRWVLKITNNDPTDEVHETGDEYRPKHRKKRGWE